MLIVGIEEALEKGHLVPLIGDFLKELALVGSTLAGFGALLQLCSLLAPLTGAAVAGL